MPTAKRTKKSARSGRLENQYVVPNQLRIAAMPGEVLDLRAGFALHLLVELYSLLEVLHAIHAVVRTPNFKGATAPS